MYFQIEKTCHSLNCVHKTQLETKQSHSEMINLSLMEGDGYTTCAPEWGGGFQSADRAISRVPPCID